MNEAVQKLEAELKQEKARAKRFEKLHHAAASDLALAHAELLRSGSPAAAQCSSTGVAFEAPR